MSKIRDILSARCEFRPRYLPFLIAVVGLAAVIWEYTRTGIMSGGMAWTLWAAMFILLGFAIRATDHEVITAIAWSVLGLIGSTIIGVAYYELMDAHGGTRSFLLANPGGLELLSFGTLALFVGGVLLIGFVLAKLIGRRQSGSTTLEQAILTEEEYEEFKPDPSDRDTQSLGHDGQTPQDLRWPWI